MNSGGSDGHKMDLIGRISAHENRANVELRVARENMLKLARRSVSDRLIVDSDSQLRQHEHEIEKMDEHIQQLLVQSRHSIQQHDGIWKFSAENMEAILSLHQMAVGSITDKFKARVEQLQSDFESELVDSELKFIRDRSNLQELICMVDKAERERVDADQTDHASRLELIRTRGIEVEHQMKADLGDKIDFLKSAAESKLAEFSSSTDPSASAYKNLLARDESSAKALKGREAVKADCRQEIEDLRSKLNDLGTKKNESLRHEKSTMLRNLNSLKGRLKFENAVHSGKLVRLATSFEKAKVKLQQQLDMVDKIERMWAQCEKLVVIPGSPPVDYAAIPWLTDKDKALLLQAIDDERHNCLERFDKRHARALIHSIATEAENARIHDENEELKAAMRTYLEGVSINDNSVHTLLAANKLH